jgi:hypothetical protein
MKMPREGRGNARVLRHEQRSKADTGPAAAWWGEVERYASAAPGIVRDPAPRYAHNPTICCEAR